MDLTIHLYTSYHKSRQNVNMTTGRFAASNYFPKTCRAVFERHWKNQIERLLQHPDNHAAALLSMVACMELAFLCKKNLPLYPKKYNQYPRATRIIEEFFPKKTFPGAPELGGKLTNGLKHNSFIRRGVGLLDTLNGKFIPEPIEREGKLIWVAPTAFWKHIKPQIEAIYAKHNCPYETFQK